MQKIILINLVIAIVFFLCYSYQFLYVIASFLKMSHAKSKQSLIVFAVLIAARNEESVIKHLIDSLNKPNV